MNVSLMETHDDYISLFDGVITKDKPQFLSFEKVIEAILVLLLCFTTTISNLTVIASLLSVPRSEVIDFYVASLAVANLLVSTIVIPFSLAAKSNVLGCYSYVFCSISGYLHVSLSAVCMYTFMWMSVDRYLVVKKPLRYDAIQTRTRCKCWILFTWVMSTFLCCPPLLGNSKGHFYAESFMCLLDVKSMLPYSITLGCLVLIPSVLTQCYTYSFIFTFSANGKKDDSNRYHSDYLATFIITAVYIILWMPWGILRLLEHLSNRSLADSTVRFWLLFMGELHSSWTALTLLTFCRRCQAGLRVICTFCVKSETSISV